MNPKPKAVKVEVCELKLYAVVIGRRPKCSPYVAYAETHPIRFAVFKIRRQAEEWKKQNKIWNGYIVRFRPTPKRKGKRR